MNNMNPFALFLSMAVVFGSISVYESCHLKDKPTVKKTAPVAINFDSFYLTSHGLVRKENSATTQNADLWFEEIDSTHTLVNGKDTANKWIGDIGLGGQLQTKMTIEGNSDVMVYDSTKLIAYQKHDSTMVIIGDSATVIRVILESMDYTGKLKVKYPKQ